MTAPVVTVEPRGHVAIVWLDDPERRNAMAPVFWDEFPAAVADASADPGCRAIVVAANGPAFTVGLDLAAFGPTLGEDGATVAGRRQTLAMVKRMQRTFSALADCPQPVLVATHGWCIGAGVDLVTAADIRIAAADTVFSVRETRLAMVADVGTLQRLPRIVGPGHVAELVYTGRDFTAAEAESMGLVNRVLPDRDTAVAHAVELAEAIAANSPLAVQGAKAVLRAGEDRTLAQSLDYVAVWNAAFLHSGDLAEAVQAFTEKRPPEFDGD
jgi:enoyl-CoA hydratase